MEESMHHYHHHHHHRTAVAPHQQQQPRAPQTSIHNLRTSFQLLNDEEFESEVEIERTRRASLKRVSHNNDNNNNNIKKRASTTATTASTTTISRKKQKTKKPNSVSNVTLPVAAAHGSAMRGVSFPSRSPLQPTIGFSQQQQQPVAAAAATTATTTIGPETTTITTTKRQGWDEQYNALAEFKAEHNGSVHVSKKQDSSLYWWIAAQRTAWRKFLKSGDGTNGALTQNQVVRLIEIGLGTQEGGPTNFANSNYSTAFETKFNELQAFFDKYGHSDISPDTHKDLGYQKLGRWVEMQRSNYRNLQYKRANDGQRKPGKWGCMTEEQYERLKALNFRFETNSYPEFDTRLDQLIAFQREFGHTRVPIWYNGPCSSSSVSLTNHDNDDDPTTTATTTGDAGGNNHDDGDGLGLGQWVRYLRKQRRINRLDPVRVAMLDGIDFDWIVDGKKTGWNGIGVSKKKTNQDDDNNSNKNKNNDISATI